MIRSFQLLAAVLVPILIAIGLASDAGAREKSTAELGKRLSARLEKALKESGFSSGPLGIWVGTQTEQGVETFFSRNESVLFIPASLSKLITAGAVLSELHPGFKFTTELLSDAPIKTGQLKGNLYLRGGGDPSFVSESMWVLVNHFLRNGVTAIDGDLVVDDTLFDSVRFDGDRQKARVDRAYDAPVGAMSMNWNSVTVYVRPGGKVGDPPHVFTDVSNSYLKIRNKARTAKAGRGKRISVERSQEKGFDGDVIVVSGSMALDAGEAVVYKSIAKPDLWSGSNLVEFLGQRGVTVKGRVRPGVTPAGANVLASYESKPLAAIVADMLKWSNNYVAEMLVKSLAARVESPGTMGGGIARLQAYFENRGFATKGYKFVNAAGFTRNNLMTPLQLGRFLESMRTDFTVFPEYLSSLPIAGVDGTLRSRMNNSSAEQWVRAKTGLLNGVVGLAGYAGRASGTIVTFVFIYNGSGKENKARALFDRMASRLVED